MHSGPERVGADVIAGAGRAPQPFNHREESPFVPRAARIESVSTNPEGIFIVEKFAKQPHIIWKLCGYFFWRIRCDFCARPRKIPQNSRAGFSRQLLDL